MSEPHVRLESMRILLYLLQGAYKDFKDMDEGDEVSIGTGVDVSVGDKGTGEFDEDCLVAGATSAYMVHELGLFQVRSKEDGASFLDPLFGAFDRGQCPIRSESRLLPSREPHFVRLK